VDWHKSGDDLSKRINLHRVSTLWLLHSADIYSWLVYYPSFNIHGDKNFHQDWISSFRKQYMTSAMNMTAFKYMHLITGKIIRTLINSTEYIKLISLHFPIYTLLWDYMNFKMSLLNNIFPPLHDYWNRF